MCNKAELEKEARKERNKQNKDKEQKGDQRENTEQERYQVAHFLKSYRYDTHSRTKRNKGIKTWQNEIKAKPFLPLSSLCLKAWAIAQNQIFWATDLTNSDNSLTLLHLPPKLNYCYDYQVWIPRTRQLEISKGGVSNTYK